MAAKNVLLAWAGQVATSADTNRTALSEEANSDALPNAVAEAEGSHSIDRQEIPVGWFVIAANPDRNGKCGCRSFQSPTFGGKILRSIRQGILQCGHNGICIHAASYRFIGEF
jgi:hypothetical protein